MIWVFDDPNTHDSPNHHLASRPLTLEEYTVSPQWKSHFVEMRVVSGTGQSEERMVEATYTFRPFLQRRIAPFD